MKLSTSNIFPLFRNLFAFIGLLAIFAIIALVILERNFSWFDEEKEEFRLTSPAGEYDAVVTVQEPGAFGSSIVRLYITPSGAPFGRNKSEFKFDHFRSHTIDVQNLRWLDARTLIVMRSRTDKIYQFDPVYYDQRDTNSGPAENWRKVTILLETR